MEALKDLKLVHNTTALVSALFAALQKYRVYEIEAEQSEMQMKTQTTNEIWEWNVSLKVIGNFGQQH